MALKGKLQSVEVNHIQENKGITNPRPVNQKRGENSHHNKITGIKQTLAQ